MLSCSATRVLPTEASLGLPLGVPLGLPLRLPLGYR